MITEYEYAGWTYQIIRDGETITARALPDQHPSAYKDRHCRAAIECFLEDGKRAARRKTT